MSNLSLEALGFTQAELQDRVVDRLVQMAMREPSYNEDGDEVELPSAFSRELQKRVIEVIEAKIAAIAEKHIVPRFNEQIDALVLQETNQWGEKTNKQTITFIEYMVQRANTYLIEPVDYQGKSKTEVGNSYSSWSKATTRVAYMLDKHFQYSIENSMKEAVTAANKSIASGIVDAIKIKLAEVQNSLKIEVKTK